MMASIAKFVMNPFYENTYILWDKTLACAIIDPGCYTKEEQDEVTDFILRNKLKPELIINTHCHIDHVLGNRFVAETYDVPILMHKGEVPVLHEVLNYAPTLGIYYKQSPDPSIFVEENDLVHVGEMELQVLFTPGHSPASVCFYCAEDQFIISGDVLFFDSIGRTDLPGGDYDILMASIQNKLLPLDDKVIVYPGHMQQTTIGRERKMNPFLTGEMM
jgi:glyoxylase-like metal-dependent hydrolase (beta-lactamase superfamily II)